MSQRFHSLLLLLSLLLAALAACSPNDPFDPESWANRPPVVSVWVLRADPDSLAPTTYNDATFHWSGVDRDGFVVGYHVAITEDGGEPQDWIFTTREETTRTYVTDENGRADPTLYVVAQDERGALSDTVSVTFPLFNFPPNLQFAQGFEPVKESIGVASFEFFGFDIDGDDTLLPFVDYRYEGSDPDRVFEIGDPLADPSLGWVRTEKDPTRFSLALKGIPSGDPAQGFQQTLYLRLLDEAGGIGQMVHRWVVYEAVGQVLLVDDTFPSPALASRDSFYRRSLRTLMPAAHTVWDISEGLPDRDGDIWSTITQFRLLVWYTGGDPGTANLQRAAPLLTQFVTTDLDPDTPEMDVGRLFLETQYITNPSQLSPAFVQGVIGVSKMPDPRSSFRVRDSDINGPELRGLLEVQPQLAGLPLIGCNGTNYLGDAGLFFGLYGLATLPGTAELYRFESYTYTDPRIPVSPLMAVRRPDTGLASTVTFAFQFDYCNALDSATEALGIILRDHLGQSVVLPGGAGQ